MSVAARETSWLADGRAIVDRVSLAVEPGETLRLIGPNGSGKSSLLRLLAGLRRVASGVMTFGDHPIAALPRRAVARRLAFVEQHNTTEAPLTVRQVVALSRTPHRGALEPWQDNDAAAIAAALATVGLSGWEARRWITLSGGERQRVQIARALAQTPTELLLDEPTNHLDVRHQIDILGLVANLPVTAVAALHDLNLAAMFCDRLAVLQAGRLIAIGSPEAVLTEALVAVVFGVSVHIARSPRQGRLTVEFLLDQPREEAP